ARYASVFVLGAITLAMQDTFMKWSQSPYWSATAVPYLSMQFLSTSELVIISRAVGTDFCSGHSPIAPVIKLFRIPLMVWNLRRIGTKWQIRNILPYSVPRSRIAYAFRTLVQMVFVYLLLDTVLCAPPVDPVFYSVPKQTLGLDILKLSRQDFTFRVASTVSFYATTYCVVTFQYDLLSLLFVLTGLSSPDVWPPFFGSPYEGYSLRRFWSVYWHQALRKKLTGHADLISDNILAIPRRTKLSAYTRLWLTFLISGIYHVSSDLGMGIPFSDAGSFTAFLLQPVGIVLEDLCQGTFGKVILLPRVVKRALGLIWVWAFLSYSNPVWFYAQLRLAGSPDEMLPVRVVPKLI
ncbi:hypothetical protein LZ31DRAFT_440598, partial [Colletotrichum somersetense]